MSLFYDGDDVGKSERELFDAVSIGSMIAWN